MRLANRLNIPVPRTVYVDTHHNTGVADGGLDYPVVLKPHQSRILVGDHWLSTAVRIVSDATELRDAVKNDEAFRDHPYMIQEYIRGTGAGVFALYDRGTAHTFFAHRRLREKPPSGGVSVLSESCAPDPRMVEIAKALLDEVGWHGVAMVEFKVAEDGTPYLMEVNTRFWGSLQLAIDAGVDFPWLLYQLAQGETPPAVTSYRTGRRLRWLLGDLDSLYLTLRDSRHFTVRQKLGTLLQFLTPSPFRTRHEVDRWDDMGPFWYELQAYLKALS